MKKIKLGEFVLIDKPAGWTSFDVVAKVRRLASNQLCIKKAKVGHAGTLDPFATGLLIVAVGREATKRLDEFKALKKVYVAELELGRVSDTGDTDGTISEVKFEGMPEIGEVREVLGGFLGKQSQIPPMFSAKKVDGKRLYELARQGKEIERKPCKIEIYKIKLKKYDFPKLIIEVECSAGTYIRTLADDIGKKFGTGAYCKALHRIKIGDYSVRKAYEITEKGLKRKWWRM